MKKQIYFLVSLFALIGFSANVMGQTVNATQYPGETHKFKVDQHSGATYEWGVYSDDKLTAPVKDVNVVTLVASDKNEVSVTWQKNASGNYYVGVKETIGSCFTQRYSLINVVAAAYDLFVENKDDKNASVLETTCMNGVGQILTMSQPINIKTNDLYFKVTLNNGTTPYTNGDWKFDYSITVKDKNSPQADKSTALSASVSLVSTGDGMPTVSGLSGTAVSVSKVSNFVIKVVINDNPGVASTDDIEIEFTASNLKVGAGEVQEATTGDLKDNSFKYTRNTYPNTSVIEIDK